MYPLEPHNDQKKSPKQDYRTSFGAAWESFFSTENLLGITRSEGIWLAHLFLLPYYKYLLKQPGLFYQSVDDEWLQIQIEYGTPLGSGRKKRGGDKKYKIRNSEL